MAEYIERESVEKFIENGLNNPDKKKAFGHDAVEIMAEVHYMPAADVAPVVRCRECKHFNLQTHECENELLSTDHEGGASYSLNFYDDDFCSYGEKKNE